jgi:thiol-disulfide isomerase/thioredoxin
MKRGMRMNGYLGLLALAATLALLPTALPAQGIAKAAAFKATDIEGKERSFPADYKGRVVMLDFWATWCGPCVGEVPGLVAAYGKYHDRGFDVLGISLDQANSLDRVRAFMKQYGMTWPQVYDGKYWDARIARFYGIRSIPSAFLVDGDTGKVLASGNSLRGDALDRTLAAALSEKRR